MASTPVTTAAASETPRLSLPRPEPPRFHSGKTFFWGIVLILAVGFLAWLIIGHFGENNFEDYDQTRVKGRLEILAKRNADDAHWLNDQPGYVDKAKGQQIRVPIDEAIKLVLPALQANKPHAAYPMTGDHLPQPAAAPTSPDKGAGSPKNGNVNPSASNPTLPQASPGAAPAVAQSPTPVPPGTSATPPPAAVAPAPAATPQVGTAATSPPTPPPTTTNNALNPGTAPSGAQPQPPPPAPGNTETTGVGSPTPSGAQPQPLTTPTPPPAPLAASSENTPSPSPKEPGATPGGTP